jgi:transcriptional regulator with XRE-family HTH domain
VTGKAGKPAPDAIDIAVGARVRERRRAIRMSQFALANQLGVTFQQVQKYERGDNRVSASTLVRVAQALDTSVAALVGEDGARSERPMFRHLAMPGAFELLDSFAKIGDPEVRRAVLRLAKSLAKASERSNAA